MKDMSKKDDEDFRETGLGLLVGVLVPTGQCPLHSKEGSGKKTSLGSTSSFRQGFDEVQFTRAKAPDIN